MESWRTSPLRIGMRGDLQKRIQTNAFSRHTIPFQTPIAYSLWALLSMSCTIFTSNLFTIFLLPRIVSPFPFNSVCSVIYSLWIFSYKPLNVLKQTFLILYFLWQKTYLFWYIASFQLIFNGSTQSMTYCMDITDSSFLYSFLLPVPSTSNAGLHNVTFSEQSYV